MTATNAELDLLRDLLSPLAVNLLAALFLATLARLQRTLDRWVAQYGRTPLLLITVTAVVIFAIGELAAVAAVYQLEFGILGQFIVFALPAIAFSYLSGRQLYRFWRSGIAGIDRQIRSGIDYSRSLQLARTSLEFLGTGASKLTTHPEFEEALKRCDSANGNIRFLLSKPDAANLRRAASRAGRAENDYRHTVIASLRRIVEIKNNRQLNIHVRFYDGPSPLRLMLINDRLGLLSYNVFGDTPADRFPQLHLTESPYGQRSFYWAFRQYFDFTWAEAEEWDFQSYLGNEQKEGS